MVLKKRINFSNEDIYKKISISDLILLSLYSLSFKKEKMSFEEIVAESFRLFPKIFSLKKFENWPDSRKLDRPLRNLRSKKFIKGDPKTYFSLTNLGKKRAREISKKFYQKRLL